MAIVGSTSNPDVFVTFTCNPEWPEIQQELLPGQTSQDRPDLVSRVFKLKLDALMDDLFNKHVLGKVIARMHVIEFQKRGLPHAHILLILDISSKPKTIDDIDSMVCAELPDPNEQQHLFNVVTTCMLHGPCGHIRSNAQCMKDGRCSKRYPREFSETTVLDENAYPVYRRRDNGQTFLKNGFVYDNRYIVPYNPYLSAKYSAHINVEIATSITSVKYLYKYVYKGSDRAMVALLEEEDMRDEIKMYLDARYVSASEGELFL